FFQRQMPLKGKKHLLKCLPLIFGSHMIARKMDIDAATTELSTQIAEDEQIVGSRQDMDYVSSKSNTLDQQEDLFQPGPLADFLLRFSVTNLHTLSKQKFAAGLHKEPVVLPIAFHTAAHPFPIEPDF
ncbi:MAG TPA: hypothetical protein VKU38_20300, partial [Ktedonobacteraceae bacterium]|nr:hypothetical protein [Ktedonobacteraceae bacterium]